MDGRRLLSVGLVVGLLVATALASLLVLQSEQADDRQAARGVADQAAAAVTSTLRLSAAGMRGANAVVDADGEIPAERFSAFADGALAEKTLTAVAFAPLITADERSSFGRPIVAPAPDGTLRRQGDAAEYLPISRVSPLGAEQKRALGYDQLGESRRAEAARKARDTGRPQLTRPLVLAGTRRPGVTIIEPVYESGKPIDTVAQRRKAFSGVIIGAVSVDRLRELVAAQLPIGATFSVADEDRTLVAGPARPAASRKVSAFGRDWTVGVAPGESSSHALPVVIAIGGTILALLAGAVLTFSRRRERSLEADRDLAERIADRDALLLEVGATVDAGTAMDARMQALAELLATRFADVCVIDHLDGSGRVRRTGLAARRADIAERLRAVPVPAPDPATMAVIERGEPLLVEDIDDDALRRVSASEEELVARRELGLRSAIIVPLAAQGVITGALSLSLQGEGGRRFGPDDLAFSAQLAQRVSLALDNARLYESEHEIATTLQQALLPPRLPAPPGVEVGVRYRPAGTGVMVGGDFYDLFRGAEGWIAVVGDVRGKGPRAAAVTALVRHTLRARAATDGIVAAIGAVNDALRDQHDDELFCSIAAVELTLDGDPPQSGRVVAAVAGHPPPLVLGADRQLSVLNASGPVLGPFEDPEFTPAIATLRAGDTLLLYTDGLSEARRDGEQMGESRLYEAVRGAPRGSLGGLLTHVELEAVAFAQGQPQDDIALVALRLPLPSGETSQDWMRATT
ncbi:MAG: SpoIIE family protein phosphatase [Solirubrobacteraceae bacterium]|nr:SpoIIE family protein phosphatase [Solirubrobacteraceae bacterium]